MAKSLNKVLLIGNIGNDIDIKTTAQGMSWANISLATSERKKNQQGGWEDATEWHKLVLFDKTAELVSQYCHKGSKIYVEGRIETTKYTDKKTNTERWSTQIIVNNVILLDGKSTSEGVVSKRSEQYSPVMYSSDRDNDNSDVPF